MYKLTGCIYCATGCCFQARKEMGKSIKFRQQEVSECVQTYPLHRLCTECCLQARKEMGNQPNSDNKRSVSVYKLTSCMDCATGCCLQARKEMGKSIKYRQQEVSECVQTYILHGMCHRVLFTGKERDGEINQVQTTKWSVSVYKLTGCIDCVQNVVCRQGKRWESTKFRQQEVSECVQTYILHGLCHRVLFAGKERDGKINQIQTTQRSVSVYKLTYCMDCARGCCLQARKEMGKSTKFRQQEVSVYKLTICIDCATGCCLQARKEMGKSIKFRQQRGW